MDSNDRIEKAVLSSLAVVTRDGPVCVAVSGGADSTALLHALAALRLMRPLYCVHIQHGLRGDESLADEVAVRMLCGQLGVRCIVKNAGEGKIREDARERGCGIEAAARKIRHSLLGEEARRLGASCICIAHNRNDLLETFIMRVLRGAGPAGLAAMPQRRGLILRPFLGISRPQILAYLAEHNVDYRTDSSNFSDLHLRNRIRNHLVPLLDSLFPGWEKGVVETANTQRLLADFLQKKAAKILREHGRNLPEGIAVPRFYSLPQILREETVFAALDAVLADEAKNCGRFYADPQRKKEKSQRRALVRRFAEGAAANVETAGARLAAQGGDALIGKKKEAGRGFSLVIKKEGTYRLAGITVHCRKTAEGDYRLVLHRD